MDEHAQFKLLLDAAVAGERALGRRHEMDAIVQSTRDRGWFNREG
jgi:hypothetical protein